MTLNCNNCKNGSICITDFVGNPNGSGSNYEYYECKKCGDTGKQIINNGETILREGCIK